MVKNHLTRLTSPKSWKVKKKTNKWIAKPMPGPHSKEMAVTLNFLLKDMLGYAKTTKEVKTIINEGNILIDNKIVKEYKYPVGLMDIVEIPKIEEIFRITFNNKGKIVTEKSESGTTKICKVVGKTIIKNGKMQVNLHDGKNIITEKFEGKVGDSIILDFKNKKINKILPLKKNSSILLIGGKNLGHIGTVIEVKERNGLQKAKVIYEQNGQKFETLKDYIFITGETKAK